MTINELLTTVVEELKKATTKGESFSAFDITKKLRLKHNVIINHADVKNLVHKLMTLVCDYEIVDNGVYKLYTPSENVDNDSFDHSFDDWQVLPENRKYVFETFQSDELKKAEPTQKNSEPELTAAEVSEKFWDDLLLNSSSKKECKKCDEGCDKQVCKKIEKKSNNSREDELHKFLSEAFEILLGKK